MRKTALTLFLIAVTCAGASAQNFLERLKDRAKDNIERKVENRVEQKVDDAVDNTLDKIFNPKKKDKKEKDEAAAQAKKAKKEKKEARKAETEASQVPAEKPAEPKAAKADPVKTQYAKSDFVPGDEILFEDTFENERLGEFPLRWDLLDGYVETTSLQDRKVLSFTDNGLGQVMPLMKEKWNWLPDIFTLEYDLFVAPISDDGGSTLEMSVCFGAPGASDYYNASSYVMFHYREDGSSSMEWYLLKPGSDDMSSGGKALGLSSAFEDYNPKDNPLKAGQWNHFAFSFNKRAFKGYINGQRIINVPAMAAPGYLFFNSGSQYRFSGISNVRIAQGAVPLYDRLMSEGKIVTYAITFETGKADLKPESMVEINRVATLMKENPDLEFEVQGHCDATGSDKVNDPLSQQRAEAIVAALVDQGIAGARLTPVGKGSHEPIASNGSEEGRAKNRRVEFVKK
ncbi:MAG: OmpA family protein [Bacteroidales bacterium]|nr:OmpA family protein [Bacteroidales bacterium]